MPHSRSVLKEALARAIEDEGQAALQLALAVLERGAADGEAPTAGWRAEAVRQEADLVARQRTVDALKAALSRLPEARESY